MQKKIYFTVKKQLTSIGDNEGIEETNGWKDITVYDIVDGQPKIFAEIEARNEDSSIEEIQVYLDNNGYEDEDFEIIEL